MYVALTQSKNYDYIKITSILKDLESKYQTLTQTPRVIMDRPDHLAHISWRSIGLHWTGIPKVVGSIPTMVRHICSLPGVRPRVSHTKIYITI